MKKINQKQKNIMKLAGTFLFCVALILILNLIFNNNDKIAKKYTGTWAIGYNFYEGETEENLLYTFVQELHLLKDGTFYTKDITTPKNANDTSITGTYEVSNDKLIFSFKQNNEDKSYISKTEMEERLISLRGGRAAEKIALNEISTGASNDIEVATQIARDMVIKYGMSDIIGPVSLKDENGDYPLEMFGKDIGDKIGKEVKQLIDIAYSDAQSILKEHYDKLDIIAQTLLVQEKIDADTFKSFFEQTQE